jgi:hypothetical protein
VISLFTHFEAAVRLVKTALTRNAMERSIQWKKCRAAYAVCLLSLRACWDQTALLARTSVSLSPGPAAPLREIPIPVPPTTAPLSLPAAVPESQASSRPAAPLSGVLISVPEPAPAAVAEVSVEEIPAPVLPAPIAAAEPASAAYSPRPEAPVAEGRNSPHSTEIAAAEVRDALDEEMFAVRRAQRSEAEGVLLRPPGTWRCFETDPRWHLCSETIGTATVGMCQFAHPEHALKGEFISSSFDLRIGERAHSFQLFASIEALEGPRAAQFVRNRLPVVLARLLQNHNVGEPSELGVHRALKSVFAELDKEFREENRPFLDRYSGRCVAQDGAAVVLTLLLDGQVWTANLGNGGAVLIHEQRVAVRLCRGADVSGAAAREEPIEAIGLDDNHAVQLEPRVTVCPFRAGDQLVLGSGGFFSLGASTELLGEVLMDAEQQRKEVREALAAYSTPGERGLQAVREALRTRHSLREEMIEAPTSPDSPVDVNWLNWGNRAQAGRASEESLTPAQLDRLRKLWRQAELGAEIGQDRALRALVEKSHPETLAAELVHAVQPRHLDRPIALSCMVVKLNDSVDKPAANDERASPVHSWHGECPLPVDQADPTPVSPVGSEPILVDPPSPVGTDGSTRNSTLSSQAAAARPAAAAELLGVPTAIPAEPSPPSPSELFFTPQPTLGAAALESPHRSEEMSAEQTPAHGARPMTAAETLDGFVEEGVQVTVVPDNSAVLQPTSVLVRAWNWVAGPKVVTPPGGPAGSASSTAPTSPNGSGPAAAPLEEAPVAAANDAARERSASFDVTVEAVKGTAAGPASPRPPSERSVPLSVEVVELRDRRDSTSSQGSLVHVRLNDDTEAQIPAPAGAPHSAKSFSDEDWGAAR